jgi:hypothetical protein
LVSLVFTRHTYLLDTGRELCLEQAPFSGSLDYEVQNNISRFLAMCLAFGSVLAGRADIGHTFKAFLVLMFEIVCEVHLTYRSISSRNESTKLKL